MNFKWSVLTECVLCAKHSPHVLAPLSPSCSHTAIASRLVSGLCLWSSLRPLWWMSPSFDSPESSVQKHPEQALPMQYTNEFELLNLTHTQLPHLTCALLPWRLGQFQMENQEV